MRCCIRYIGKERFGGMFAAVLFDKGDRLVTNRVRVKEAGVDLGLVLDVVVAARQCVGVVKAASADDGPVELVEATLQRPSISRLSETARHMPFAAHVASITAGLERAGDRDAALVEIAGITLRPRIVSQNADTRLMWMQARQQRRAGRAAAGRVVELGETQTVAREPVEVRRIDLAAVAPEI